MKKNPFENLQNTKEIIRTQKELYEKYSVPIERIVPGINTSGLISTESQSIYDRFMCESTQKESTLDSYDNGRGDAASTEYMDEIYIPLIDFRKQELKDFLEPISNTVFLDLGAGGCEGYHLARELGAKAYIAVDKFKYPYPPLRLRENTFLPASVNTENAVKNKYIVFARIREDMLNFLKRMPDNSASILTCGVTVGIGNKYARDVEEQIKRVLDPNGAYITHMSNFEPKGLKQDRSSIVAPYHGGLLKFTKK